jgi:hypothetical protein
MSVTQTDVLEFFNYEDGNLFWKKRSANRTVVGSQVSFIENTGYVRATFKGKRYGAHQLIFLIHHGYIPEYIDHIDGDKLNNRIENLRSATKSENALNKKVRSDSFSGIKNVHWYEPLKKWVVNLSVNKKRKHIGYFADLELAELVAIEAREKFHNKFSSYCPRRM